jgi:hypothetical protein
MWFNLRLHSILRAPNENWEKLDSIMLYKVIGAIQKLGTNPFPHSCSTRDVKRYMVHTLLRIQCAFSGNVNTSVCARAESDDALNEA